MRFIRQSGKENARGHTQDAIERMILARGYKVGDQLPTYRELAQHFGITVRTVERVMRQMADEGTIQLMHGKGTFVKKLPAGQGQLSEVGLVYPSSRLHLLQTDYLNQILSGVILQCDREKIDLQIVSFHQPGRPETVPVPPRDISLRVDGVLLLGVLSEWYLREFMKETIPLVLVDGQAEGIHSLCADNEQAVSQVMGHLHGLGHRRIAYLDARSFDALVREGQPVWVESPDTRERREAYRGTLRRLGLSYERVYPSVDDDPPAKLADLAAQLRREADRPTAIIAYDAPSGIQLRQALTKAGWQVPQDLSVAGIVGARGFPPMIDPEITCGIVDFRAMGERAFQVLMQHARGSRTTSLGIERIPSTLHAGASSGPARQV